MENSKYQKTTVRAMVPATATSCAGPREREKMVGRTMATDRAVRYAMLIALALAFPTVTAGV